MIKDRFGNKFENSDPPAESPSYSVDTPQKSLVKLRGEVNAAQRRYDYAMQNVHDARAALNRAIEINVAAHQNLIEARNRLSAAESQEAK